jgi:hypothetical protein
MAITAESVESKYFLGSFSEFNVSVAYHNIPYVLRYRLCPQYESAAVM